MYQNNHLLQVQYKNITFLFRLLLFLLLLLLLILLLLSLLLSLLLPLLLSVLLLQQCLSIKFGRVHRVSHHTS